MITVWSNNEEISIFIDPDKSSYTILNLKCGTKYQFNIQSMNSVGRSNRSNLINAKTKGDGITIIRNNENFNFGKSLLLKRGN